MERKHKTLLNTARALSLQASLPITFWGDCILTATYLLNRTPVQSLQGVSPYQILFNEPPAYNHLKVFGALCYATNTLPHKDKFEEIAYKCVFLSYPFAQKAYTVLNIDTRKVFVTRDVTFCESVFPFASIVSENIPARLFNSQNNDLSDPFYEFDSPNVQSSGPNISTHSESIERGVPSLSNESSVPVSSLPVVSKPPVRQSTRTKSIPAKFQDFVGLPAKIQSSMNTFASESVFTSSYQKFIGNVYHVPEPTSYK